MSDRTFARPRTAGWRPRSRRHLGLLLALAMVWGMLPAGAVAAAAPAPVSSDDDADPDGDAPLLPDVLDAGEEIVELRTEDSKTYATDEPSEYRTWWWSGSPADTAGWLGSSAKPTPTRA